MKTERIGNINNEYKEETRRGKKARGPANNGVVFEFAFSMSLRSVQ